MHSSRHLPINLMWLHFKFQVLSQKYSFFILNLCTLNSDTACGCSPATDSQPGNKPASGIYLTAIGADTERFRYQPAGLRRCLSLRHLLCKAPSSNPGMALAASIARLAQLHSIIVKLAHSTIRRLNIFHHVTGYGFVDDLALFYSGCGLLLNWLNGFFGFLSSPPWR